MYLNWPDYAIGIAALFANIVFSVQIRDPNPETTMRSYLTPVRMVIMEKTRNKNVGEDVEKSEPCTLLVGM